MKKTVKRFSLALCMVLAFVFTAGCGATVSDDVTIGVAMPSKNLQRWNQDGDNIRKQLQAKGYKVELQYTENDVQEQIAQIERMIENDCKILVIAAIDGPALRDVLKKAADKKIKVIAYDRLIMDSPNVDYYATFNNFDVGVMQGTYIAETLDLKNNKGPFNLEIFAGSENDNNSQDFYKGAIEILKPYIDDGVLVVQSGQVDKTETSIQDWSPDVAQERMTKLLKTYYSSGHELDAILSSNDSIAYGIIKALKAAGYGGEKPFPILTGQDCDKDNVIAMLAGEQSMSVFKDTRALAARTVEMIDDLIVRNTTTVNDSKTYNNGVKVVPTYVCTPVFADKDNYKQILVESGYYNEADLT